jgi:hypothetical protein
MTAPQRETPAGRPGLQNTEQNTQPSQAAPESIAQPVPFDNTADAKRFCTLRAQFALKGHALYKSGPGDGPGPVSYLVERWGLVRHLPTLDDAERFLAQIGQASKYSGDQS